MIQYMSSACRAARSTELRNLPSAWLLRQVTDDDAQKCRNGRLNYLGIISFVIIAIPMTCILLNEALGGAIVDSVIPAFYSAIFLLGTFLHSVSIIALIVTFIVLIIALNYWTFVYVPARQAHIRRKDKMKRLYHEYSALMKLKMLKRETVKKNTEVIKTTNYSRSMSLSVYLHRVIHIIKRSIQHAITLLSFRRMRHMKSVAAKKVWCGMNRSSAFQGIVDADLRIEMATPVGSPRNKLLKFVRRQSTVSIPDGVTHMLSSLNELQIQNKSSPHKSPHKSVQRKVPTLLLSFSPTSNQYFNEVTDFIPENQNDDNNDYDINQCDPVIHRLAYGEERKRRKLRPLIIFEATEVILALRSRLITFENRNSSNNNSNTNSATSNNDDNYNSKRNSYDHLDISETVLFTELKRILEIYYPDGVALSETEKAEACESYNTWKQSINEHFSIVLVKLKPVRVRIISFKAFEDWFQRDILNVIRNNLSDRLLDNSLRHSPNIKRRLHMANANTPHIVKSPQSPSGGQMYMRGLKVVTPQDLMIRNTPSPPLSPSSSSYDYNQFDEQKSCT